MLSVFNWFGVELKPTSSLKIIPEEPIPSISGIITYFVEISEYLSSINWSNISVMSCSTPKGYVYLFTSVVQIGGLTQKC